MFQCQCRGLGLETFDSQLLGEYFPLFQVSQVSTVMIYDL